MRILLIDDDAELGEMLAEYLEPEGFALTVARDGEAGLSALQAGVYALVLLDVMLPGIGGMDVLQHIRRISRVPVIMVTARGDKVDRIIGLEMGADDYLPKPCDPRELLARLRAVLRRTAGTVSSPEPALSWGGKLVLSDAERLVTWNGVSLDLTVTEFNFLQILLRAGNRVVSKEEFSEQGLGRPREAYDRSVDVHVSNVRLKLDNLSPGEEVIETVRGVGYRMKRTE